MSDLVTITVGGINPAEIELEGSSVVTISGGSTKIDIIEIDPAEIEIEGVSAVSVSGSSVELILDSPAEIEIEGGGTFTIGAEITVSPAEIEIEGVAPLVSHLVSVLPAGVEIDGVLAVSVSGSSCELVLETPADVEIKGIAPVVFIYENYSITFQPASIYISGVPAVSIGAEITVNPASVEIEGVLPTIHHEYYETISISESIFAYDTATSNWICPVSDTAEAADTVNIQLFLLLSQYLDLKDSLESAYSGSLSVDDTAYIQDTVTLIQALNELIDETFAATDSAYASIPAFVLAEYLQLKETIETQCAFNKTVSESVAAVDATVLWWVLSALETADFADVASIIAQVSETVGETVTLTDVLSSTGVFYNTVNDSVEAADSAAFVRLMSLSESVAAVDAITDVYRAVVSLSDTSALVDSAEGVSSIAFSISESVYLLDTVSIAGRYYSTISETVCLDVSIVLDDEVYECYVLNTPKFLPSVYSGFNFNSYCEYQNRAFGANNEGIFELTGTTDNGNAINTGIVLHETDFGTRNDKRFRKAYLGISGTAPVLITETEYAERKVYAVQANGMVEASRGIHARTWALSIADFDTVETVSLMPILLSKSK